MSNNINKILSLQTLISINTNLEVYHTFNHDIRIHLMNKNNTIMTTNTAYIYDLHKVYKNWLNELALSTDEITFFKINLEKIVTANNQTEVTSRVEQFQNQFITHLNELQLLRHDIKAAENEIEKNITENPIAVDHRKIEMDTALEDRMIQFQKLFLDLKNDFTTFLAKTL